MKPAKKISQVQADLALLMVALVWGFTFVTVKNALDDIGPHFFNAIRFFIAALFLAIIYHRRLKNFTKETLVAGVLIGIALFAGYGFQTVGLKYTTASNAGFITGLSVVLVPLFSTIITRQPPAWPIILAVIKSALGLALLSLGSSFQLNWGDFLVFLCAISFALHIILVGRYAPNLDPALLATVQIATVSAASSIWGWFTEIPPGSLSSEVISALFITAIPATALAFLIQTTMQSFTTPTRTAIIFSTEPVFAALFAFLFLGEILTPRQLLGAALILAAMLVAELLKGHKEDAVI
ncbi:DMT family transporter [Calderihabitans maritimus]|uniref:EamA domain-containing protein n=1 Tax=Calderihabitans maritimus TaxID=1246530 RepID=A0A1Z5HSP0_9FIRM|nr:DMT family transporter [Calderihabitans maritimus]GAW92546.1 hypothetical protein KKC1_17000 [Calderihabitans maritimus]